MAVPVLASPLTPTKIDAAFAAGMSFETIEDVIDEAPDLATDAKAALWLYAWSSLPRRTQRSMALGHITSLQPISG